MFYFNSYPAISNRLSRYIDNHNIWRTTHWSWRGYALGRLFALWEEK